MGERDTRIPVYMVSFSEITTECLGFPSLRTKPSDSKYSSLTPASPLNYTEALPTTETQQKPLQIGLLFISEVMPCSNCLSPNRGTVPKYNATESDVLGTQSFREGGKRDPGKVHSSTALGPLEKGGFLEGRRTQEPKWGNPSLSSEEGWIPSRRLQPVPLRKRIGGQRALSSERGIAGTFRGPGASRFPASPGRQGVSRG